MDNNNRGLTEPPPAAFGALRTRPTAVICTLFFSAGRGIFSLNEVTTGSGRTSGRTDDGAVAGRQVCLDVKVGDDVEQGQPLAQQATPSGNPTSEYPVWLLPHGAGTGEVAAGLALTNGLPQTFIGSETALATPPRWAGRHHQAGRRGLAYRLATSQGAASSVEICCASQRPVTWTEKTNFQRRCAQYYVQAQGKS